MILWAGNGEQAEVYSLLAELLRQEYGLEALPPIEQTAAGKPWFPTRPELAFNVSHSGGLLLCGAGSGPLGVDIERVRPRRAGLARYVLGKAEYQWYASRGAVWEDFYSLWTLKEARCKCTGAGLDGPARKIAVPLLSPGEAGELDGLRFRSYGGTDWRAAACTARSELPPEELVWFGTRMFF